MAVKKTKRNFENVDVAIIQGLAKLSEYPEIKYLYSFVKLQKFDILKKHFNYPYTDPIKNSHDKAFFVGKDEGMTMLINAIKNAGDVLDKLEEDGSK